MYESYVVDLCSVPGRCEGKAFEKQISSYLKMRRFDIIEYANVIRYLLFTLDCFRVAKGNISHDIGQQLPALKCQIMATLIGAGCAGISTD